MSRLEDAVLNHYSRAGLLDAVLTGLKAASLDSDKLQPADLAPVDEFHTAGRLATLKALEKMPLKQSGHVLDAGCGIGGTARVLAKEYGCRVTGIDLTPEYIEVAKALTERMRLSEACEFHVGNVIDMPFPDASFDAAISFHVAMNISARDQFYSELARVLRSGAPLCLFDVMEGSTPGMTFPVPWAESAKTSFLRSPAETRKLVGDAGFVVEVEESLRDFAIDFFREAFAKAAKADGPPPLGLHLIIGASLRDKLSNYANALENNQLDPVVLVARRG